MVRLCSPFLTLLQCLESTSGDLLKPPISPKHPKSTISKPLDHINILNIYRLYNISNMDYIGWYILLNMDQYIYIYIFNHRWIHIWSPWLSDVQLGYEATDGGKAWKNPWVIEHGIEKHQGLRTHFYVHSLTLYIYIYVYIYM